MACLEYELKYDKYINISHGSRHLPATPVIYYCLVYGRQFQ